MPNLNIEYHMLYVESRKSFKVRREKKLIYLPSAKKTLGKIISLPSTKGKHSANLLLLPSATNGHSVNS